MNNGDNAGNVGGSLQVKCAPDDDANNGYTSGNGALILFAGAMQFDEHFPWIGQLSISCLGSNTYVQILELYDGG
jgi:hypothetical protein